MLLMVNIPATGSRYLRLRSRRIPANEPGYPWGLFRAPSPPARVRNTHVHWILFAWTP